MNVLSIIIPVLNESATIGQHLRRLKQQVQGIDAEIIVVDGGSDDDTFSLANAVADVVIRSEKGRAKQMNAGAKCASGDILLFLHIDTFFPDASVQSIFPFLNQEFVWGFYTLRLSGISIFFRVIETMINIRSRTTQVATGDQCLFIKKQLFMDMGGFADMPLMEDVEITKRLRRLSSPFVVKSPLITSSRRWEKHGIMQTVLLMWSLRALYFIGVSPNRLARWYG